MHEAEFGSTFHMHHILLILYQQLAIDPFQLVGMQLNWRTEQWVALCMIIDFIAAWRFSFVLSSSSKVLKSHLKGVYNSSCCTLLDNLHSVTKPLILLGSPTFLFHIISFISVWHKTIIIVLCIPIIWIQQALLQFGTFPRSSSTESFFALLLSIPVWERAKTIAPRFCKNKMAKKKIACQAKIIISYQHPPKNVLVLGYINIWLSLSHFQSCFCLQPWDTTLEWNSYKKQE